MFAFGTSLKVSKSLRISCLKTSVSSYRAYAAMATNPKTYSLNRKYPTSDITYKG